MNFCFKREILKCVLILLLVGGTLSCKKDNSIVSSVDFDRGKILSNLSDNYILPALKQLTTAVEAMDIATLSFADNTDTMHLSALRTAWSKGYLSWHGIAFLDMGKSEALAFLNFMNTFPTSETRIKQAITSGNYDLNFSFAYDRQGFPALDYLINGIAPTAEATVSYYQNIPAALQFLKALTTRMKVLCNEVLSEWEGAFASDFVASTGNTATSALNLLLNDLVRYYEMSMRSGQVGIPAGIFSRSPLPEKVEALYDSNISKKLFLKNLNTMEKVYKGAYYLDDNTKGTSIYDYIKATNATRDNKPLFDIIADQFQEIRVKASAVEDSFYNQIATDNDAMKALYGALQANVIYMKVDMMTALNVRIDYIDADGD